MAKILVVDDNITTLTMLRLYLQKEGHEVIELTDGTEVMNSLISNSPDLLITDIFMPDTDGIQVICNIRELLTDLPIIAISGGGASDPDFNQLKSTLDFGANATLTKPVDMSKLLSLVEKLLT